jgi:hypothetical protein
MHAAVAAGGLLVGDLLGWAKVCASSPTTNQRTFLDVIISTLLGPAFVLRELPEDVRWKRSNDRFVIAWASAMIAMMTLVVACSTSLTYIIVATLVGLDTLLQANSRLGAVAILSRQSAVMTRYLVAGGRSDAY